MKAMFLSDMLTARKYLISTALTGVIVGLFIAVAMKNIYVIVPCIGCLIPFSVSFTLFAYDERNDWQCFRLALPLSRQNIIRGRYLSMVVIVLAAVVVGVLCLVLAVTLASLFPQVGFLEELLAGFQWFPGLPFTILIPIALMLLVLAITLPLVARFGLTKAVRFVPIVIVLAVPLSIAFNAESSAATALSGFAAWIQTDAGIMGASLIAVVVTVVLYMVSCALSTRFYRTREL